MPGVVRPPYGAPTGPFVSDDDLAAAYLAGARTGHSEALHIEEDVLLVGRMMPVAIRLGPDTAIIRTDVDCPALARVAEQRGLVRVEREPALATVVALQRVGHSAAPWDLWATDSGTAASLLAAAT